MTMYSEYIPLRRWNDIESTHFFMSIASHVCQMQTRDEVFALLGLKINSYNWSKYIRVMITGRVQTLPSFAK